jgi:DNA-binding NarL/FixJ family response regulator
MCPNHTPELPLTTVTLPTYPDDLTASEVEVLRLLATGVTDAEIAEKLYVSRRTIQAHLRCIYSKIGVRSRTAAARYAIQHSLI